MSLAQKFAVEISILPEQILCLKYLDIYVSKAVFFTTYTHKSITFSKNSTLIE